MALNSRISIAGDYTPPLALGGYVMPHAALRWFGPLRGFCFDLSSPACFARQDDPANGDALVNFSNSDAVVSDGEITVGGGVAFAGGGLDFSACPGNGNYVKKANAFDEIEDATDSITATTVLDSNVLTVTDANGAEIKAGSVITGAGIPAATRITTDNGDGTYVMSANATAGAPDVAVTVAAKEWIALYVVRMAEAAAWPAASASVGFAAAGKYSTAADLFTLYYVNASGTKNFVARVQQSIGSTVTLAYAAANSFGGKLVQILVYRQNNATRMRLVTLDDSDENGASAFPAAVACLANTQNLSGLTARFGLMSSTQIEQPVDAVITGNQQAAAQTKLYFEMVQSLKGAVKTPVQIADEHLEWARELWKAGVLA